MAAVVGGIGIAHTPSMGVEFDRGTKDGFSPRWQPWFDGSRRVAELLEALRPDHLVVVYNDHLNYFDLDNYPTLAIGVGERFSQADEGWGRRDLPDLPGDLDWGVALSEYLVEHEFDMTISHDLAIDHGIFSWLPYVLTPPWPLTVTPIVVNMIRQPLPTPRRLRSLGRALRSAVSSRSVDERVVVVATGGMSHQIAGARFGMANLSLDEYFLRRLPAHLDELVEVPMSEWMRLGGTEAVELTLWFAMRAALSAEARDVYQFHTFPQITGCGALVLAEPGAIEQLEEAVP